MARAFNATKPRILVLHSTSQDSAWAQQMDRGMRQALQVNRRPISVDWLYLDAGSPMSARETEETRAEARRSIDRIDPDVLIAVDDEANALVAQDFLGRERRILYVSPIARRATTVTPTRPMPRESQNNCRGGDPRCGDRLAARPQPAAHGDRG